MTWPIVPNFSFFLQFDDDSTTTYNNTDLQTTINIVEKEFQNVLAWLYANKLVINLQKTHLMLFTNRKRPQEITLNVNGSLIHEVNETKFLGIIVDNKLTWQPHVKYISGKISKSLSIIRYLRYSFPEKILKTLYLTLVLPYLMYCNIIWGAAYDTVLNPLYILQKKSVRTITKSHYLEHTQPLFLNCKILTVYQIYDFNCAKFIFNVLNTNKYPNFKEKLNITQTNHHYNTRGRALLRAPFERLQKCMNSYFINGIRVWNNVSEFVRKSKSIIILKVRLKNWLFYGKPSND